MIIKLLVGKTRLLILTFYLVLISSISIYAQGDNPYLDQVPLEWLENINYSDSEEDVITDSDGYDNFNLGVDYAEPHLSQNPINPLQYFGAYNINNAWRTSNGHDWISSTPNFGTSVAGDPVTAYDGVGNLYYESMYGSISGCKVIRSTNNGATWSAPVTAISGNDKNWMAADQTTGPYANYVYTTMTPGNFARSTDFGATWTTTATFSTQTLPGMMVCVGPNGGVDGGAVYVVTNSGNVFSSTYTFYLSTNGGASFSLRSTQYFANYVGTNVNGRHSVENMRTRPYPFIAADQSSGSYRGRLYCVYASNTPAGNGNKPDIFCRYSTNQGTTWSSAIKVNDDINTTANHQWHPSIWCDKSSGRLFVKWMDTRDTPTSDSAYIYASYSDNGGVTWAPNQRISNQKMKINCTTCGGGTPRYQGDYDAIVSTNNQSLMMWTDFRYGNFGSYVGYFPDFAMKVSPSTTTIENSGDSAFINIDVPSIKLYNSTAIFSANISPTPPSGSIILDFPQGNTLNTFPGSVPLRVRTSGNVTLGTYTINIQGEGSNGTPVHRRTATLNVILASVSDPIEFYASAISYSQIDLTFTPNASNHNVIIVWDYDGTFTTPSGTPPPVGSSFAGGTLLYNGTISPVNHTGLSNATTYYYKAFSNSGTSYSPGLSASATTLQALDFSVDLLVFDNCANSVPLVFGTAPGATDCYDEGLDQSAPPPPPVGAFDARFQSCGEAWFTDIRGTNTSGEVIWDEYHSPASGCNPVTLSWDPAQLPPTGYFHLVDPIYGLLVNVNMRTTNNYTDELGLGHLQIKYNYQFCSNYNIASGWNMLSLPLDVSNNNYLNLFPNAEVGTLFGYSGTYYTTETMLNGVGYWLKFPSAQIEQVCGDDRTESVLSLNAGWNMIGGPNCNVPLGSVSDPGGIIVPGTLYGYSGSYTSASSIDATKAYWIKATAPGTIAISCNNVVFQENNELNKISEVTKEFSQIEIRDGRSNTQFLYFNGKLKGNVEKESYSLPPVPPEGSFDARIIGDYRLSEGDEVTIQIQTTYYPISITVMKSNDKIENDYMLQEIAKGIEVGTHKIENGSRIVITNKEVTHIKIGKQQSIPTTYSLEQNYPNPFNPGTTIKFSLPEGSNVTLNIYSTLGQKVAELVSANLEAGRYSYQWDASDISSGVYIYELRTEKFVSFKKMILMK